MMDRDVSVGCMIAYLLWLLSLLMMIAGTTVGDVAWQNWALLLALGAGTATIRSYFVRQNRIVREALAVREEGASVRRVY